MKKALRIFFIIILIEIILSTSAVAASNVPSPAVKKDIETMISAGLIAPAIQKDYSINITKAEFIDTVVRVYEKVSKKQKAVDKLPDTYSDIATSSYRSSIKKALSYRIINGKNKAKFQPQSSITREQCATMIYQMMKALGAELSVGEVMDSNFYDTYKLSSLAVNSIEYCAKAGIIPGTSSVDFSPSKKPTREEAYIMLFKVGRACGLFRDNIPLGEYGELAGIKMYEEKGKLYYMQVSYRFSDESDTGTVPFYELWCADTVTGKVALYHKFQQKDFKDKVVFYKDLVAMDTKYFYVVGQGIFTINRNNYQCKKISGTDGANFAYAYKSNLYFSQNNKLCKYSFDSGKVTTIITFKSNVVSGQMSIVGDTIYVLASPESEYGSGLYRVDTDGSSVSYLGNGIFRNVYLHKAGILAESYIIGNGGFQSDIEIYEFGYDSRKMLYVRNEMISLKNQVLDGILYRPFSISSGSYKVLKSEDGRILCSISGNDDMLYRCGDYYYFYEDSLFYALNLRTGHAIANLHMDARDATDYYYKLAEKVKELIKPSMTDVEKAKVITDWICKTAEYDYPYYYGTANPPSPESGYALGLFYDGQLVCGGYVDAAIRMFQLAGLDCYMASGKTSSGEPHAWIHIKIDGKYYVTDVTWDDAREAGQRYYNYFLIALNNYPNQYKHNYLSFPDINSIFFSEEDYPLADISRGVLYTIP